MFWYLVLGWVVGYTWCCIWRLGRPPKESLVALIIGWLIGRSSDRTHYRRR